MNIALFRFLNDTIKNPLFDDIIPIFSDKDYVVIPGVAVFAAAMYFATRRTRVLLVAMVIAIAVTNTTSEQVLKEIFQVKRPYARYEAVHAHRGEEWVTYSPQWYEAFDTRRSYGFPSSHAANAAAFAAVLALWRKRSLRTTIPLALMIGISRIYTGNHTPVDVLGGYVWGATVGLATGWAALRLWRGFGGPALPERRVVRPPERKAFLVLLGAWTLVNYAFVHSGTFTLSGDEAQYWTWSRHLQWGYYSKPPLIAWLIAALTASGGNKEWAIRSGAVLLHSGTLALIYSLTLRISKRDWAAFVAVLAAVSMPASWVGSVILTPDAPLAFFWILAMYAFHRAVAGEPRWWLWTGFALGTGLLAKYTILILAVSFALYLLLVDRQWWRTSGPYLAGAIMALCALPVLYWNWQNDWVSFRHTAAIGAREGFSVARSLKFAGAFIGGQLLLVSPLLFCLMLWSIIACARKGRANKDAAFLALSSGVLLLFYFVVAFRNQPQPNWAACSWLGAAVAFGWLWTVRPRAKWSRWLALGAVGLGCSLGGAARSTELLYVLGQPAGPDNAHVRIFGIEVNAGDEPTSELRGMRELGRAVSRHLGTADAFVFSSRYQMTALLAFYVDGRPRTYCINVDQRRLNQYDLWDGWQELTGQDGLFVLGGDEQKARAYLEVMVQRGFFENGEFLETVPIYRHGILIRRFTISRMRKFTGKLPDVSEEKY